MKRRMIAVMALALASAPAFSAQPERFHAPVKLVRDGVVFTPAYRDVKPNGSLVVEYTAGEPVVNWTRLFSVHFIPAEAMKVKMTPELWVQAQRTMLGRLVGTFNVEYSLDDQGGAQGSILFPPNDRHGRYETDAQRVWFPEACNGVVMVRYSERFPDDRQMDEAAREANQAKINRALSEGRAWLQAQSYTPQCNPEAVPASVSAPASGVDSMFRMGGDR